MYGFIWRHLPGPTWLKVIESLVLVLAIVWLLFNYAFPWLVEETDFFGTTIS